MCLKGVYCLLVVGYTTDDLRFMWEAGDPVQMEEIALPQFDIKQEDIEYGNCTKFYAGTGMLQNKIKLFMTSNYFHFVCQPTNASQVDCLTC